MNRVGGGGGAVMDGAWARVPKIISELRTYVRVKGALNLIKKKQLLKSLQLIFKMCG